MQKRVKPAESGIGWLGARKKPIGSATEKEAYLGVAQLTCAGRGRGKRVFL